MTFYKRKEVIGDQTLYLGDCMEIMPHLGKFDAVVTDPPYKLLPTGKGMAAKRKYLNDIENHLDGGFDISLLDSFKRYAVFCAKAQLIDILNYTEKRGLSWTLLTWNKPNPTPLTNNNYLPDTEYIIHAHDNGGIYGEYKDKARYIVYPVEKNNFNHPTVKPLTIMRKILSTTSEKNQNILDPFMGSGTTLVACADMGRKGTGIELDEDYFNIACKRVEDFYRQGKLL